MPVKIFLIFSEHKKNSIMCFFSRQSCVLVIWKGLGFFLCLQKISEVADIKGSYLHLPFRRRWCQFCKSAVYSSSHFTNSALLCKKHLEVVVFVHIQTVARVVFPFLWFLTWKTLLAPNVFCRRCGKRKWMQEKTRGLRIHL